MKKLLSNIIVAGIIVLSLTLSDTVTAQDLRYGLEFNSFETVQEKRTSLNLTPAKAFSFQEGFSLSFDMCYNALPEYNFGYIFRIIGTNDQHIDFLINITNLTVVNSEGKVLAECLLSNIKRDNDLFLPFSILVDIKNNRLDISIDSIKFSPKIPYIKDFRDIYIIFGRCNFPQFQTSDVPRIIVKDIKIGSPKGETLYFWPLWGHAADGVYDELRNRFAKAENPTWLVDAHAHWKKRLEFNTLKNPQIAYNPEEKHIVIADKRNTRFFDTRTGKIVRTLQSSGVIHSSFANQMVYNHIDNLLYSYCLEVPNGKDIAVFDTISKKWTNTSNEESALDFWHHNKLISDYDSCLYTFGGYGHHRYKDIINKYSFENDIWEELQYKDEKIQPRYLSGLGMIDRHTFLIFGGYGSETGQQELTPHNYYDLHMVDIRDLKSKKIWELEPQKNHFVVANSMVVDTLNKCFYALCFPQQQYNTSLSLAKFSLEKSVFEIVSDNIPYLFRDISSYADLFLNEETNELWTITYSAETADSTATVSIYSLSYPPIAESTIAKSFKKTDYSVITYLGLFILVAMIVTVVFIRRRRNGEVTEVTVEAITEMPEIKKVQKEFIKRAAKRVQKQAFYLFGGFQVRDKEGKDITGAFSPLAKHLFILVLLNTMKDGSKGISSRKLKDTLWLDKSEDSARNNKGVTLNKLRHIFEQIGVINIENHSSYLIVKFGDDIYCDYCEALALMRQFKNNTNLTRDNIMKLVGIVSYGEMLPNLQIDWVDSFKADFANDLINILLDISSGKDLLLAPQENVYLADAILIHDILNEEALKLKCKSLVKMGKNGLAKAAYNAFVKEYINLFSAQFKFSFEQIIS
ncbi:MAG: hypothetical protein LBT42_00730 [Tannerella sp.]|jgi:two-component SAPR family response regulator|nr:hypothetical protein [Tannerella sp.]